MTERRPAARVQRRHAGGARRQRRPRDARRAGSASSLPPAAPIIGSMPDSGMDLPPLSLPPSVEQDPVAERQPSVASFREHTDYVRAACRCPAPGTTVARCPLFERGAGAQGRVFPAHRSWAKLTPSTLFAAVPSSRHLAPLSSGTWKRNRENLRDRVGTTSACGAALGGPSAPNDGGASPSHRACPHWARPSTALCALSSRISLSDPCGGPFSPLPRLRPGSGSCQPR